MISYIMMFIHVSLVIIMLHNDDDELYNGD